MSLSLIERVVFAQSLRHPALFRSVVRPALYRRNGNDPERVHEAALHLLQDQDTQAVLRQSQALFQPPDELLITLAGKRIAPFGTAAGFDKNGDALEPLSHVFGFQEPGTVVLHARPGNARPRLAVDNANQDLYNAQGFPSLGLEHFLTNLGTYRWKGQAQGAILVSVCGLPVAEQHATAVALKEIEILLTRIGNLADGFVWNPFSPNTVALGLLRTPEVFRETAQLMRGLAPDKLRLVKMGPYEDNAEESKAWLTLAEAFLSGGGHGIVAVNTRTFAKEHLPVNDWGYASAGRSGRFLQPYRLRAVRDARKAFPQAVIIATGGISDGRDAYETFAAGATALEGYTPYTYHGYGLLPRMMRHVAAYLRQAGHKNLEELQAHARSGTL